MDIFAPRHLILILLIALVIFGTKKLRTIGSDLGGAVKGFKDSMKAEETGVHSSASATAKVNTLIAGDNDSHAMHKTAEASEKI